MTTFFGVVEFLDNSSFFFPPSTSKPFAMSALRLAPWFSSCP